MCFIHFTWSVDICTDYIIHLTYVVECAFSNIYQLQHWFSYYYYYYLLLKFLSSIILCKEGFKPGKLASFIRLESTANQADSLIPAAVY